MTSRTGLEAEAISRLTDGLQPAAIRAILVQCLTGELASSAAISQMLAVFVENVEELADVSDSVKNPPLGDQARASRPRGFGDRDEPRISE